MENKPWVIDWAFKKESGCFNCHKEVTQEIIITPTEIVVTCANCKSERHYTIHGTFIAEGMQDFKAEKRKRKYDIWKFERNTMCANCLKSTDQSITMDEYRGAVVCPSCLFTRIYKFNLYTKPQ